MAGSKSFGISFVSFTITTPFSIVTKSVTFANAIVANSFKTLSCVISVRLERSFIRSSMYLATLVFLSSLEPLTFAVSSFLQLL